MDTRATRRELKFEAETKAPGDRLDQFENGLRGVVGSIRAIHAVPALMVHQNRFYSPSGVEQERLLRAWERFYPRYTGPAILEFDRLAAERTRRVARDSGVVLVDPAQSLSAETPVPFADFSHFTDRGAAIVGGLASRALSPAICAPK